MTHLRNRLLVFAAALILVLGLLAPLGMEVR